jgi:hypothetical protein
MVDVKKAQKYIKTVTDKEKFHNAKDTDIYYYRLQFQGNTIMNLTKVRSKGYTYYESDLYSTVYESIKEAKQACVKDILLGNHGMVLDHELRKKDIWMK